LHWGGSQFAKERFLAERGGDEVWSQHHFAEKVKILGANEKQVWLRERARGFARNERKVGGGRVEHRTGASLDIGPAVR